MKIQELNHSESIDIRYGYTEAPFGKVLVAKTEQGICYAGFTESTDDLKSRYPQASIQNGIVWEYDDFLKESDFHLKGTEFQLKVWKALLNIPTGETRSYSDVAKDIGSPNAVRAVGTAIGQNPITILIPCHRVLRSDGSLGGYYWGLDKKRAILDSES